MEEGSNISLSSMRKYSANFTTLIIQNNFYFNKFILQELTTNCKILPTNFNVLSSLY